jgi:hypothetical protein
MRPWRWLQALLQSDFKLRRDGHRLRIVVERPGDDSRLASLSSTSSTSVMSAASTLSAPQDSVTQGLHAPLRRLLKQHQQTRDLMRHLSYVERALRLGGANALDDIPLEVLAKALPQLKTLVTDWQQPGIADLRSRLSVLVATKEEAQRAMQPANSRLSDFFTTTRMQVSEGTASDFQAVAQDWKAPADR